MKPVVLCFGGFDPTGGAGIQADIEAVLQTGAQVMPVITALTSQNTQGVYTTKPVSKKWLKNQAAPILSEFDIAAIKIGMCTTEKTVKTIKKIIKPYRNLPIILDPILKSGTGTTLGEDGLGAHIFKYLLPLTYVLTPNLTELDTLTGEKELADKIHKVINTGCKNLLLTNTDKSPTPDKVIHQLFKSDGQSQNYEYEKLPGKYHGSGCTLAASLAAFLSQQLSLDEAVIKALDYTWHSLKQSEVSGKIQNLPNRKI